MPRPSRLPFLAGLRFLPGVLIAAALVVIPLTAHGQTPVADSPNGRVITLLDTAVEPGGTIRFTGTGYINDGGVGQSVTAKLNDVDILGTFEAATDGTISGTVTIPASLAPGDTYWLRFLAGAGKPDDMPPSSLHVDFSLVAAPGSTTTVAPGGAPPAAPQAGQQSGDLVNSGDQRTRNLRLAGALAAVGVAGLAADRLMRRSKITRT